MILDIVFGYSGSFTSTGTTLYLPVSGSQGSPRFIELQTTKIEKRLQGKEIITIS